MREFTHAIYDFVRNNHNHYYITLSIHDDDMIIMETLCYNFAICVKPNELYIIRTGDRAKDYCLDYSDPTLFDNLLRIINK